MCMSVSAAGFLHVFYPVVSDSFYVCVRVCRCTCVSTRVIVFNVSHPVDFLMMMTDNMCTTAYY